MDFRILTIIQDTSVDRREIRIDVDASFSAPKEGTCLPPDEDQIPENPAAPIYLYLAVKDSGPGLKPDDLNLLFKRYLLQWNKSCPFLTSPRFQQGSNSHDVFGGSGLGRMHRSLLPQLTLNRF